MCVLNHTQLHIYPASDHFCLENYVLHCIISGFLSDVECYKVKRYSIGFTLVFSLTYFPFSVQGEKGNQGFPGEKGSIGIGLPGPKVNTMFAVRSKRLFFLPLLVIWCDRSLKRNRRQRHCKVSAHYLLSAFKSVKILIVIKDQALKQDLE